MEHTRHVTQRAQCRRVEVVADADDGAAQGGQRQAAAAALATVLLLAALPATWLVAVGVTCTYSELCGEQILSGWKDTTSPPHMCCGHAHLPNQSSLALNSLPRPLPAAAAHREPPTSRLLLSPAAAASGSPGVDDPQQRRDGRHPLGAARRAVNLVDDDAVGLAAAEHGTHLHRVVDALRQVARRAVVRGVDLKGVVPAVAGNHVRQRCLAEACQMGGGEGWCDLGAGARWTEI